MICLVGCKICDDRCLDEKKRLIRVESGKQERGVIEQVLDGYVGLDSQLI